MLYMPRFRDAVGYLLELKSAVNQNWFTAAVEAAISSNDTSISQTNLESFWGYATGTSDYTPSVANAVAEDTVGYNSGSAVFLESISSFNNFKKLSSNLNLEFNKKITIIFGKNGSGKSSICEALKVLASPDSPLTPLNNVRNVGATEPSFSYRFRGWNTSSIWSESAGFGSQAQFIKYFDSMVAISNSTGNMTAENAVSVVAFRLEVFDYIRSIVLNFQNFCRSKLDYKTSSINQRMGSVLQQLKEQVDIQGDPFNLWQLEDPREFDSWLQQFKEYDHTHEEKFLLLQASLRQHKEAATDQGQLVLKAQLTSLKQLEARIISLLKLCDIASPEKLAKLEESLATKKAAEIELSKNIMPDGQFSESHQSLIFAASRRVDLDTAESCPLCFQGLSNDAKELFRRYHSHLTSTLQRDIQEISRELNQGLTMQSEICAIDFGDLSVLKDVAEEAFLARGVTVLNMLKQSLPQNGNLQSSSNLEGFNHFREFKGYLAQIQGLIRQLSEAINTAMEGGGELKKKILEIETEIAKLLACRALSQKKQELLDICGEAKVYVRELDAVNRAGFTVLLRNLTIKGKEAHSELVLGAFEEKLNNEYLALSGMKLEQAGVKLVSRGADQNITVAPQIGREHIRRVLSEGEQKVHALAVFMAEATAHPNRMLVFDDPVTSFDYNYVSNFCQRFRDFSRSHPETQIVVFTHNWDFFVNLQSILNRSQQSNDFVVQVLEDCVTVEDYKEKWDELCDQINEILAPTNGERSAEQKERVCGLMRRLIERLSNEFVFNNQRHQYKIKALKDSNFDSFTKIVPLTMGEANKLRDLYGDLSPPEHDDLRNFYTTRTREQLNVWYEKILEIKVAVKGRRP